MNKNPPSLGRIAAMVGFTLSVAALLMFLWTAFGGTLPLAPQSYRFKAAFPEASLLVKEADVRMAGVNIGKVKSKELGPGGRTTLVEIELDDRFAPIGRDARAILRQKSLLGETYVELTPGSPEGKKLDDGGTLARANVDDTVELDEVFRVFDPETRDAFQQWLHEAGIVTSGRWARDFNDSLGNAAPFFEGGADLLRPLAEQEVALRRVFRDTGRVFNAVSREDGQLRGLITGGDATFGALASRDDALAETFAVFPTFLRETRATVRRLEAFARNTDPLVRDLREPARDLAPTLRDLGDLSPDLEKLFRDIDPLVRASRTGVPAAERFLKGAEPVLEATHTFMPELNPILSYLSFARGAAGAVHHRRRRGARRQRRGRLHGQRRRGALPPADRDHRRPLVPAPAGPPGLGARELVHRPERLRPRRPARRYRELRLQAERRRADQPGGRGRGGRAAVLRAASAALERQEVAAPAPRRGPARARSDGPPGHPACHPIGGFAPPGGGTWNRCSRGSGETTVKSAGGVATAPRDETAVREPADDDRAVAD